MKLGSHVGMSGKEMLLGSAKEAVSYGANTFMFYTGAPQNTRRKEISELNITPAWEYMKEHGIDEIIVHAPYIINLGNSVKHLNLQSNSWQRRSSALPPAKAILWYFTRVLMWEPELTPESARSSKDSTLS